MCVKSGMRTSLTYKHVDPHTHLTLHHQPTNHEHQPTNRFTLPDNPHDRFDFTLSDDLVRASQKLMAFESEPFGDKRVPVRWVLVVCVCVSCL